MCVLTEDIRCMHPQTVVRLRVVLFSLELFVIVYLSLASHTGRYSLSVPSSLSLFFLFFLPFLPSYFLSFFSSPSPSSSCLSLSLSLSSCSFFFIPPPPSLSLSLSLLFFFFGLSSFLSFLLYFYLSFLLTFFLRFLLSLIIPAIIFFCFCFCFLCIKDGFVETLYTDLLTPDPSVLALTP